MIEGMLGKCSQMPGFFGVGIQTDTEEKEPGKNQNAAFRWAYDLVGSYRKRKWERTSQEEKDKNIL